MLGLATLLAGCASGPYQTKLMVKGGDNLNPTFDSAPSKVNIRIVQLKSKNDFLDAKDEELRADGLKSKSWVVDCQEAKVRVGSEQELEVMIQPEVRFLGIVGLFNEFTSDWKTIVDVNTINDNKLVFDQYKLSTEPREQ